ncbi:alkylphosphonate utilization protein [Leucobacter chromiireducens]|uniref:Alkylphosphonate utilization protein n=1 Tax=Leucobacter chromiireducens subsp. chromiireducens TaxID=660067 RepID=A0ABS1SNE7_9MICO|nr:alkylphosphonate utilization protein [Leucobacter chromiireducens]MBL3689688.1 alkylphosphonate utilization protein [Leucobacter chromiireducens subsp. chromiireducens]
MTDETPETTQLPPCPECGSEYAYEMGALLVCPMCAHEWAAVVGDGVAHGTDANNGASASADVIRDSVGNVLSDGDTVTVVKTVKVSGGGGGSIKAGTKVTGIRLAPGGAGGHDIDARVPGFGKMMLKSSVVRRAN